MSMEAFEKMQFESDVYFKLAEAEREAEETGERFSSKDVTQRNESGGERRINVYD